MLYIKSKLLNKTAYKRGHFVRRFGYLFIGDDPAICDIDTLFIRYETPFIYLVRGDAYRLFRAFQYQSLSCMFGDRRRIVQVCVEIRDILDKLRGMKRQYLCEKYKMENQLINLVCTTRYGEDIEN